MNWMQVLTKEPLPIEVPPAKKDKPEPKKRNRVQNYFPTSINLSVAQREKLKALGGVRWIRKMLETA